MGMKETEMRGQSVNTRARDSDGNWDKKKKSRTERNVFTSLHRQRRQRKCKNIFEYCLHFDFKLPKYTVEK